MPEMDGWTFIRQLRSVPHFALVPVLFLTSKGAAPDRIAGYQLGADDYLGKPVNLAELPRRVMKALAHRRQLEEELALPAEASGGKGLKGTLDPGRHGHAAERPEHGAPLGDPAADGRGRDGRGADLPGAGPDLIGWKCRARDG
jgi:DNA-binding response OmpR family regulator